ncbi:hypothetical protein Q7C_2506 [Methylophaga frappieri]|uniref:Uncharacterized protein n=1 Tax=Methylophaga frappieri (strain ATCC BAA-2434 / DSM 25690 / JAM7) TaxID=754477 RepID=I1YL36_METFJ|nr:hypothetical protein [Methylophaga frappieri]AFJ03629.1 hypothetical protein Q7C_2506 [Methylophaga frappieri]
MTKKILMAVVVDGDDKYVVLMVFIKLLMCRMNSLLVAWVFDEKA